MFHIIHSLVVVDIRRVPLDGEGKFEDEVVLILWKSCVFSLGVRNEMDELKMKTRPRKEGNKPTSFSPATEAWITLSPLYKMSKRRWE